MDQPDDITGFTAESRSDKGLKSLCYVWKLLDMRWGHQVVQVILDLLACVAAIFCGWFTAIVIIGIREPFSKYFVSMLIISLVVVISIYIMRGYRPTYLRRQERELEIIVKSIAIGLLIIFAFNFLAF
jgi:hypothetical protein